MVTAAPGVRFIEVWSRRARTEPITPSATTARRVKRYENSRHRSKVDDSPYVVFLYARGVLCLPGRTCRTSLQAFYPARSLLRSLTTRCAIPEPLLAVPLPAADHLYIGIVASPPSMKRFVAATAEVTFTPFSASARLLLSLVSRDQTDMLLDPAFFFLRQYVYSHQSAAVVCLRASSTAEFLYGFAAGNSPC